MPPPLCTDLSAGQVHFLPGPKDPPKKSSDPLVSGWADLSVSAVVEDGEIGPSLDRDMLRMLWGRPLQLFRLAGFMARQRGAGRVTYVVNRNINFTDICVGSCSFCAFRKDVGYRLSDSDILSRVEEAEDLGATEVCLQGGLNPDLSLEDYCRMLELIKEGHPAMHLHAYSPMEVWHMARSSGVSVKEAIADLKSAGLGSMPGTAAEILVDRVRQEICPGKLSVSEWCSVIRTAHRLGIRTTSTMLYGHIESLEDRLTHLEVLLRLQAETGGFTEFVLLPFLPENCSLGPMARKPDILEHLKMHALSRVALHNYIPNIQASWVKLGPEVAGAAIEWGVNDMGGTLMEENISRSAGSTSGQYLSPSQIRAIIAAHGRKPAQRDTLYRVIKTS